MSTSASDKFSTIQYCIDHNIPCFTFKMDHTKACLNKWKHINPDNFRQHLSQYDNGFAIITGAKYFIIDLDMKHSPPQHIYDTLFENCTAVEKTPGGYHFWYLTDSRTAHFTNTTEAYWDNIKIIGFDIRDS
jgi:hypothetical protein